MQEQQSHKTTWQPSEVTKDSLKVNEFWLSPNIISFPVLRKVRNDLWSDACVEEVIRSKWINNAERYLELLISVCEELEEENDWKCTMPNAFSRLCKKSAEFNQFVTTHLIHIKR